MSRTAVFVASFSAALALASGTALAHDSSTKPVAAGSSCGPTLTEVQAGGRFAGCTHGTDPAPSGVDLSRTPTIAALRGGASRTASSAAVPGVPCLGTGTDGKRVQAVYARTQSATDRFASVAPLIRTWAAKVNDVFAASAAETAGKRQVRFVTSGAAPNCVVSVIRVVLPNTADDTFTSTINAMSAAGFKSTARKYLMWFDTSGHGICGIATTWVDDSPDSTNLANTRTGYTRVDSPCWDQQAVGGAMVEAHEVMHNLGAVQSSAPRYSGHGHCTDEFDVMCYFDWSPPARFTYPCSFLHESLFDCGHNDYFHTAPAAGSYLATHWNTARSLFLAGSLAPANDGFATAEPLSTGFVFSGTTFGLDLRVGSNVGATAQAGEPSPAGSPPSHSVWYRLIVPAGGKTLTLDTHGSSFDTVLGVYQGSAVGSLTEVASNDNAHAGVTYSQLAAPVGAGTYYVKVDGKGGASGAIVLHLGLGTAPPTITSFTPTSAGVGQDVRITIDNLFSGQLFTLWFNGSNVSSLSFSFPDVIARVPTRSWLNEDATSGPIFFANQSGWAISDTPLRVKPTFATVSPGSGPVGTTVTITGQALLGSGPPVVRFNGVAASPSSWTYTRIVVKVPAGATTGPLTVTTNGGTASRSFTVG